LRVIDIEIAKVSQLASNEADYKTGTLLLMGEGSVRRLDLKSAALITTSKLFGCSRNVVKEFKKG
jgi:hypothetical protein